MRGRPGTPVSFWIRSLFQSTPPCGGDYISKGSRYRLRISIHAPLRGRLDADFLAVVAKSFQSTPPCGGDPLTLVLPSGFLTFQSTPPCGGDAWSCLNQSQQSDFNPRPLAGATGAFRGVLVSTGFQSTPPCGGDGEWSHLHDGHSISIHAPLRGRHP